MTLSKFLSFFAEKPLARNVSFRAKRRICCFLLFFTVCTFRTSADPTARIECNSLPSKILAHPVGFCVTLPPSYDPEKVRRYPILYFLHGLGDNEQMFLHT